MTVHVDRSLRLPPSEYFPEVQQKTGIAIHHTVCVSAHATVELWRNDKTGDGAPRPVATAFTLAAQARPSASAEPLVPFQLVAPNVRRVKTQVEF